MNKHFRNLIFRVSILPALLIMPAMASDPVTEGYAWVFGDVTIPAGQPIDLMGFGGRRMSAHAQDGKYRNDFPAYNMLGQSLTVVAGDGESLSPLYVGPVNLTLAALTDENFKYNYQWWNNEHDDPETDIDLALEPTKLDTPMERIVWDDENAIAKVVAVVGAGNASGTAPGVVLFSHKDSDTTNDGVLSLGKTNAVIDGATVSAKTINVANSKLQFSKQDTSLFKASNGTWYTSVWYTNPENISSDGLTTLNAKTINIDGSTLEVKPDAKLVINNNTSNGAMSVKNVTSDYGALTVNGIGSMEIGGDSLYFNNNTSYSHGAGIYHKDQTYGHGDTNGTESVVLNAKNITFINNNIVNKSASYTSGSGSAVFVSGGRLSIFGEKNTFTSNHMNATVDPTRYYKTGGGAIANQSYDIENAWASKLSIAKGTPVDAQMVIGKEDGSSVNTFIANTSKTNGGAIMNRAVDSDGNVLMVIHGETEFKGNQATMNGGAIYNVAIQSDGVTLRNAEDAALFILSGATFNGNKAGLEGGAIYNSGRLDLGGVNKFTNNTANGTPNDIYNAGTLIINDTTTIDGGITGAGAMDINGGATLNIGTASINQGEIRLHEGGNIFTTLRGVATDDAQIALNTILGTGNLNLNMTKEGTYHLLKVEDVASSTWLADSHFSNTNALYDLSYDGITAGDVFVTAKVKSVEDVAENTGVAKESAEALVHVARASTKPLQELSVKLQEKLAEATTNPAVKAEVEHATKAIHPETESVTQSMAASVQNTVVNLASGRMAAPRMGRNGGDVKLTRAGLWAQGLFNRSKQNDAFTGNTRGIALGVDGTLNRRWTIGAGYSVAHSDIDGTSRKTEIESNTLFLYGQYKPAAWYLNAIANYTWSDYSEKGTVIDNTPIFADYDVSSFGGALNAGYDFKSGITPELGLRYMHVMAKDYANSYGVKTHLDDSNYLTGVVGAKYAFKVAASQHTTFMPQLNAGFKYDLLSDKNLATVTIPGVEAYSLEGKSLSRMGGEFGIGLGMRYDNLEISANYDIDVRQDYTSQTGMLKFRCNF